MYIPRLARAVAVEIYVGTDHPRAGFMPWVNVSDAGVAPLTGWTSSVPGLGLLLCDQSSLCVRMRVRMGGS